MSKLSGHSALQPMEVNTSPFDPIPAQRTWKALHPPLPEPSAGLTPFCGFVHGRQHLSVLSLQIHLYTDTVHGDVCCIQIRCMHGERGGHRLVPHSSPNPAAPRGKQHWIPTEALQRDTQQQPNQYHKHRAPKKTNVKLLLT